VIVPKRNEKDLPDIPDEVKNTLKFHFAETVDDVLAVALGAGRRPPRRVESMDGAAKPARAKKARQTAEA